MKTETSNDKPVILLVDDDPAFRSGVMRVLHTMRHELNVTVEQADNSATAAAYIRGNRVDLVLLDYLMPGEDGLHCLRNIRASHPQIPVIIITGQGSEDVAVNAMKSGATDYLVKGSISPEAFYRTITNALRQADMKRTIQLQEEQLRQAERQRIMIQSLGAACHHLGQPATVILSYLELMSRSENNPEMIEMIKACTDAAESMRDIFDKLRAASTYRTVPYRPLDEGEKPRGDDQIVDIPV